MRYHEFLLEYDRAKAMAGFGGKLQARLKADARNKNLNLEDLFTKLEQADPSPNKQYVNWMARAYQNGSELEDITSRGADNLAKLDQLKLKKQIKPEHSDVGKFKTLLELEAALEPYKIETEQEVNRGKYKELVKTNNARIIQLFDEAAAKYYGQGTKWCTAANRNNMASKYLKDGPLYVVIPSAPIRKGEKYQFWILKGHPDTLQLMDENDDVVSHTTFSRRFPEVFELFPTDSDIPIGFIEHPSEERQMESIRRTPFNIQYIANPFLSVQLAAVSKNGYVLKYIDNPSEEVQIAAVQVPNNASGDVISYIHKPSEKVQIAAVSTNARALYYLDNPPEAVQLAAVSKNAKSISYIKFPTEKVQIVAVKQNGFAIESIYQPSEQVQLAAVNNNPHCIAVIRKPTPAVQLAAATASNGAAIQWINNPTEEVQLIAVKADPRNITYISNPTPLVQKTAFDIEPKIYPYIRNPILAISNRWYAMDKDTRYYPRRG